jgi:hypothetical protein
MITWPIFLALFLSIAAVYISIKVENKKENKKQQEKEIQELKRLDLIKRKLRIENEKQQNK